MRARRLDFQTVPTTMEPTDPDSSLPFRSFHFGGWLS
jgi:hypothetical protein